MSKKKKSLKRLPKSPNGTRRKSISAGAYKYQKEEIKARAAKKGMTVSYYLNWLMGYDWMD